MKIIKNILIVLIYFTTFKGFTDVNDECKCSERYYKFKNLMSVVLENNNRLIICGISGSVISENCVKVKEFVITNCADNSNVVENYAGEICTITKSQNKIAITEFINLPAGENWKYQLVPFSTQMIYSKGDSVIVEDKKLILTLPGIDDAKAQEFISGLEKQSQDVPLDWQNTLDRLFLLSIAGDKKARDMFYHFKSTFNINLTGDSLDTYFNVSNKLLWIEENRK